MGAVRVYRFWYLVSLLHLGFSSGLFLFLAWLGHGKVSGLGSWLDHCMYARS